jgi:hypothetical protein
MRRETDIHEEHLRNMRGAAWNAGERVVWAKLMWLELSDFIRGLLRSGLKGIAVLVSALMGVGGMLLATNVISGLIMLGSLIGIVASVGLKNDKGGMMSAGLLLFGMMTLWLPPVRYALLTYPLATLSVVVCLALIYKFATMGGTAGKMTGGVLALYVIFVIINDTSRQHDGQQVARSPAPSGSVQPPAAPASPQAAAPANRPLISAPLQPRPPAPEASPAPVEAALPPSPPEPRVLRAAPDSVLKIITGVPYRIMLRTGMMTKIVATQGTVALFEGDRRIGECSGTLQFSAPAGKSPWAEAENVIRACGDDALLRVAEVR